MGVKCVNAEDELMIITTGGIIIRMPVEGNLYFEDVSLQGLNYPAG